MVERATDVHTTLAPLLPALRCPCCGAPFQAVRLLAGWALRCRRREWPVVEGIAVLRESHETDRALRWLARGDERRALAVLVGADLRSRTDRWRGHAERLLLRRPAGEGPAARRSLRRIDGAARDRFERAVTCFFGEPPWPVPETADYFLYRRSDPSFVAAEAAAAITIASRRTILDTGCGVGHLLASLGAVSPGATLCGLDSLFAALLLARWYVAPRAALVCADASAPLPFVDGAFDALLSVDAFFDFPSLPGAAAEFRRVLAPGGGALIAHLHNRLTPHLYLGRTPLSPAEYLEILAPLAPLSIYDEATILRAIVEHDAPSPMAQDPAALVTAPDVTITAGNHASLAGLSWRPVEVGPARINPLYSGRTSLSRGSHRYTTEKERGPIEQFLPEQVEASTPREQLLRARVLLPWPFGLHPRGEAAELPNTVNPPRRTHRVGPARWLREVRSNRRTPELISRLKAVSVEKYPHGGVVFLMGHRVITRRGADPYDLCLTASGLDALLVGLRDAARVLSCDDALHRLQHGSLSPGLSLALTFDDGTLGLATLGSEVLRRHAVRATVFVTGPEAAPAGLYWWDREAAGGLRVDAARFLEQSEVFDVAHHTRHHRIVGTDPRDLLPLDHATHPWLAYPFGALGEDPAQAASLARSAGFTAAFTTRPGIATTRSDRLQLPRVALYDAPLDGLLKRLIALVETP